VAGPINGVIPVMLTPFTASNQIDYEGLEALIEWYLAHGADALFAVCLSSEMYFLSPQERRALGRFVVDKVKGRVPVMVSGHVSEALEDQKADLRAAADGGADAVVLITNRLDAAPGSAFTARLDELAAVVPADIDLGLYECPAPARRLLTDEELTHCVDSGRYVLLKDVSCDLEVIRRRLRIVEGSRLAISNANAAIAFDAIKAGARGFCGIFANFCPDLYKWLLVSGEEHPDVAVKVAPILAIGSLCELFGYPTLAKLYHQRIGTFSSIHSRSPSPDFDLRSKCWAADEVVANLEQAIANARREIAAIAA
jgi:4-hydroxy-tetrahydrodipicolinate synthase